MFSRKVRAHEAGGRGRLGKVRVRKGGKFRKKITEERKHGEVEVDHELRKEEEK